MYLTSIEPLEVSSNIPKTLTFAVMLFISCISTGSSTSSKFTVALTFKIV